MNAVGVYESETIRTISDTAFASTVTEPNGNTAKKTMAIVVVNLFKEEDPEPYQKSVGGWSKVCEALLHGGYKVDLIAFTKGKDDMMINDIMNSVKLPEYIGGEQQIQYNEVSDAVAKWNQYEQVICIRRFLMGGYNHAASYRIKRNSKFGFEIIIFSRSIL